MGVVDDVEPAQPVRPGRGRRMLVLALGTGLAVATLVLVGLMLTRGSWWYSYGSGQTLDLDARAHLEAIRDEVEALGVGSTAVKHLNAALDPAADPTTVRNHLIEAREALKATHDSRLDKAMQELQELIALLQPSPAWETTTPYPEVTLEWPYDTERSD